jgi:hypothetical protein
MSLIEYGMFAGHSGLMLPWKVDCDFLADSDMEALAKIISHKFFFSQVYGIPTGGLRLAAALMPYRKEGYPPLLVDDVLTTGGSMIGAREHLRQAAGDPKLQVTRVHRQHLDAGPWNGGGVMTIGPIESGVRPFRPTGKGGGSEKGKPQGAWPMFAKMMGEAVILRVKGTRDAMVKDRSMRVSAQRFHEMMEELCEGFWEEMADILGERASTYERLLLNRVYKAAAYNGSSARGPDHDPLTRASQSSEHWLNKVPVGHELRDIHDQVSRSLVTRIPDWRRYLEYKFS